MIRVLVVDDDFMVARIHAGFVERTPGFEVAGTAHTGAEALRLAEELSPDIVLLDVHLPDVDGLAVLRALRAQGDEVAVVMVTAERHVDAVRTALHHGAIQYLVKPFEYQDLAQRLAGVREALDRLTAGETDQAAIDRAFSVTVDEAPTRASLPKGLSEETAALVLASLTRAGEQTAAACADAVGLSRVTARRYLEHFVAQRQARVRLNYGGAGRPERVYRTAERLIPRPPS